MPFFGEQQGRDLTWQFGQVVDAIRILFCLALKQGWAHDFDWEYWSASAKKLETDHVTDALEAIEVMTGLLYGGGLRLMECVTLRILDVDFDYNQLLIRNAKGFKDRIVPLPERFKEALKQPITFVERQHHMDLKNGFGEVYLPDALGRKYQNAAKELRWQYVFPSSGVAADLRSGVVRRHHVHETRWNPVMTFAPYRNCWGIRMCRRR